MLNCFHGTTHTCAEKIFEGESFEISTSGFDWLGNGVYFYEDSPLKAFHWASMKAEKDKCLPVVIEVKFKKSNCLDLISKKYWNFLTNTYDNEIKKLRDVKKTVHYQNNPVLTDSDKCRQHIFTGRKINEGRNDYDNKSNSRHFDSKVIDTLFTEVSKNLVGAGYEGLVSARCAFVEGKQIYRGSGYFDHINTQFVFKDKLLFNSKYLISMPNKMNIEKLNADFETFCGDLRWPI